MDQKIEILHEPQCTFFIKDRPRTCSCRLMKLYLEQSSMKNWTPRQEFAARAMQGLLAANWLSGPGDHKKMVAETAYAQADLMITEGAIERNGKIDDTEKPF